MLQDGDMQVEGPRALVAFVRRQRRPRQGSSTRRRAASPVVALVVLVVATVVGVTTSGAPVGADGHGGYWMLGRDGTVYPFGAAADLGRPDRPGFESTALATTPTGQGYYVLAADGRATAHGDAERALVSDDVPRPLSGERWTAIQVTPDGGGLFRFSDRGRVHATGSAPFLGDLASLVLDGPVIAAALTPSGLGYYMIGSDGGVFAFGDAAFHGSIPQVLPGVVLDAPIVGIAPTPTNLGYWLVAGDGGVFSFGDAGFRGSVPGVLPPGTRLDAPVNGMVAYGNGYLMVASDGGVFTFSDLAFLGSLGGQAIPSPIVGITPFPGSPGSAITPTQGQGAIVTNVVDGDTIEVRLDTGVVETVRLIGINAAERDECFSAEATAGLRGLVEGRRVGLVTDVSERDRFGRLLRYVHLGSTDVNEELVRRGLAIARDYPPDSARRAELAAAQVAAQQAGVGMWASDGCGAAADAVLRITFLRADAVGDDNFNLNDEWVEITNQGDRPTSLAGWVVKDTSATHRYPFASTFVLQPGATVRLHTGCGTDTATRLYWCNRDSAVWNNTGDTAFLLDPAGNVHDSLTHSPAAPTTTTTTATAGEPGDCHPSYPDVCIPPAPPDLDCGDIPHRRFRVLPPDPHGFDGNKDGIGCQSG